MADIEIKIGDGSDIHDLKVDLDMQKTLDDNIIISDHIDIFIIINIDKMKVVTFPKRNLTEDVYTSQNKLMEFLTKKGVIDPESIRGGAVYGSIEAIILDSEKYDRLKITLYAIDKFIKEEQPYFETVRSMKRDILRKFYDPDPEDSTELGEVDEEPLKGSNATKIPRNFGYFGWWS